MPCSTNTEDEAFFNKIRNLSFPVANFGHDAHLRLAYVLLTKHAPEPATQHMEAALKALLQANQIDLAKYHVTMTRAWIYAVHLFMQRNPGCDSSMQFLALAAPLRDGKIMETHFSPALLYSEEARHGVVSPDRDPIPSYAQAG